MTAVRVCPRCQRRFDDPELRCCPDDSADLLEELARYSSRAERVVGKVVAGRFLVERVLGEGGMGLVLAARHLTLPQRVAIKLLHPELTAVADIRDRFLREARTAAMFSDPRIVSVSDFGETGPGIPYLVMELLDGEDLYAWFERRGPLTPWEAASLGAQVARALEVMHARGLVHRDVKPENVWLQAPTDRPAQEQRVKLLDFGVVGELSVEGQRRLTRTGMTVGTPTYMSPEQIRGEKVDGRSDVYALACLIWELAAGRTAFSAGSMAETLALHLTEPAPRLATVRPGTPPWLDQLLERGMAKSAPKRPQSAAAFAEALEAGVAAEALAVTQMLVAVGSAPGPTDPLGASTRVLRVSAPLAKRRRAFALAALLAVTGTAVGALVWSAGPAESFEAVPAAPETRPRVIEARSEVPARGEEAEAPGRERRPSSDGPAPRPPVFMVASVLPRPDEPSAEPMGRLEIELTFAAPAARRQRARPARDGLMEPK